MELEILKQVAGLGIGAVFGMVCFFWYTKAAKEHRAEMVAVHKEHEDELKQLIVEKTELHKQDIACQKEVAVVMKENSVLLTELITLIRHMNNGHRPA